MPNNLQQFNIKNITQKAHSEKMQIKVQYERYDRTAAICA